MEPIEITAHFNEDGTITPLHFSFKGGRYRVESTGRHWSDEIGQHMLVMVSSGQIYELIFKSIEGRWYITQLRPGKSVV
jgi:hypothetical protein